MNKEERDIELSLLRAKVIALKEKLELDKTCKQDKDMLKAMNAVLSVLSVVRED